MFMFFGTRLSLLLSSWPRSFWSRLIPPQSFPTLVLPFLIFFLPSEGGLVTGSKMWWVKRVGCECWKGSSCTLWEWIRKACSFTSRRSTTLKYAYEFFEDVVPNESKAKCGPLSLCMYGTTTEERRALPKVWKASGTRHYSEVQAFVRAELPVGEMSRIVCSV